jgi:hypothetical protein
VQEYASGFAWGVLPTLWMYGTEQFVLGCFATGIALTYACVYALTATLFAWQWYSALGAFGIGLAMSAGAWVGWIALNVHVAADSRFRDLCSLWSVVEDIQGFLLWQWRRDGGARSALFAAVAAEYATLAVPLAISNVVGLLVGLLVAAVATESSRSWADAYGISSAYFNAATIAVLGASSAVSALVSSVNAAAQLLRMRAAPSRGTGAATGAILAGGNNESIRRRAEREGAAAVAAAAAAAAATASLSPPNSRGSGYARGSSIESAFSLSTVAERVIAVVAAPSDPRQRGGSAATSAESGAPPAVLGVAPRREGWRASSRDAADTAALLRSSVRATAAVLVIALLAAVPPLAAPGAFADTFGGSLFGGNRTRVAAVAHETRQMFVPCALAFVTSTAAMCVAASLHAVFDVVGPLALNLSAGAVGGGWTIVFAARADALGAAFGPVVAALVYLGALLAWWAIRRAVFA